MEAESPELCTARKRDPGRGDHVCDGLVPHYPPHTCCCGERWTDPKPDPESEQVSGWVSKRTERRKG